MLTDCDFSNKSLLIVDDSPINHRIVALILRGRFGEIGSAHNGEEALHKYMEKHYDIILMDAIMPVMDGFESTMAIRSYEKEQDIAEKCIIIAMTASEGGDDINRCLDSGMDAYLGKPFQVQQFLDILEKFPGFGSENKN